MYTRKRHGRAWAAIPAIVLIVVISVIAGPSANAGEYEQLEPANFAVGFVVGLLLVLISALLVALLRPATAR